MSRSLPNLSFITIVCSGPAIGRTAPRQRTRTASRIASLAVGRTAGLRSTWNNERVSWTVQWEAWARASCRSPTETRKPWPRNASTNSDAPSLRYATITSTAMVVLGTPKAATARAPTKTCSTPAARRARAAALTTATNERRLAGIPQAPDRLDHVGGHVEADLGGEPPKAPCRADEGAHAVLVPPRSNRVVHGSMEGLPLFRDSPRGSE